MPATQTQTFTDAQGPWCFIEHAEFGTAAVRLDKAGALVFTDDFRATAESEGITLPATVEGFESESSALALAAWEQS
jgi:hypothetical protein